MVSSITLSCLLFLFRWQGGRLVGLMGFNGRGLNVNRHGGRWVGCVVVGRCVVCGEGVVEAGLLVVWQQGQSGDGWGGWAVDVLIGL